MEKKFAYCVITQSGLYVLETMRATKKESIKAYMALKFFDRPDLTWSMLTRGYVTCDKIGLTILTQH